jgi:hypothetical protein
MKKQHIGESVYVAVVESADVVTLTDEDDNGHAVDAIVMALETFKAMLVALATDERFDRIIFDIATASCLRGRRHE